jgi:ABC-type Na+ efflux pump permease subunit
MNGRRFAASFWVEFGHAVRRPLFIVLAVIVALTSFGLSSGQMSISSGDSAVGGTKAWITSEFAQTQTMTFVLLLYFSFFIAIAAGLTLIRDRETKVDVLLHSTPLQPREYVWGRFLAVVGVLAAALAWQALTAAFWNHVVPNAGASEIRGPFAWSSYFLPVLTMGIPYLIFFAGVTMFVGQRWGNPVLVFVVPVAVFLLCGFLLWTWSPSWLDRRVNLLLQLIEPSGYRWLNETLLKVDRGVEYYNTKPVTYDGLFWLNRAWMVIVGIAAVFLTERSVARARRGIVSARVARKAARGAEPASAAAGTSGETEFVGAAALPSMATEKPSFLTGLISVTRAEMRELRRQAGLYIFIPLILIQCLGNALLAVGAFDTPILLTPGITAAAVANQISVFACLLLLFYTVESLERERSTGLGPILFASPVSTVAFILGKALANSLVAATVLVASFIASWIGIAVQGTVAFRLEPYFLIWGLCLVPTFFAWTAFVSATYAVSGNRYAAYALSLALLAYSGFRALTGEINWVGNWALWGAVRWSDLGFFETDRVALTLNRVVILGLGVFFMALAVRILQRTEADGAGLAHRLAPGRLIGSLVSLSPYALVPAVAAVALYYQVEGGIQGGAAKKADKDYWAKNLKTWLDAPLPDIARADIRVKVDPAKHGIESQGTLWLVNGHDSTLAQVPLTGGRHWKDLEWTMNGAPYKPEDSERLFVFTPPHPLAKGDTVSVGWKWKGRFPDGITKNGGNTDEFVLPSGVVLTGFTPSFMPVLGFMEGIGETKKDNKTEPKRRPRDYWRGVTRAGYGATSWFPARITVTGPAAYTLNSDGVCVSNSVRDGWRTQVWQTDHPAKMLNIVCGRWDRKDGVGTTIYYYPGHKYNIDEMSATLDAARRWYSVWFLPYPWKELKLSEFPALAGYAQGFGTNITFSENIGFLTRNDTKTNATFLVTAHEAAHQWWGNILTPADGPGGDFLSEGTSHFSTMLLFEQAKGPRARMEFAKALESRYGDRRRPDEERAMYDVDGKKDSDETVIYDRGGWVFWMLYDFLGHDRALAGYRNFIQAWSQSRDHPALQDFVASMRPYAADPAAYDAFVKQWMEDKVVPEYKLTGAKKTRQGDGYEVTVTVKNVGTGLMPVEVAASAGERWREAKKENAAGEGGAKAAEGGVAPSHEANPEYKESRVSVTLGAGESKAVTIHCPFEPKSLTVDPDVRVLQLRRKQAVASL